MMWCHCIDSHDLAKSECLTSEVISGLEFRRIAHEEAWCWLPNTSYFEDGKHAKFVVIRLAPQNSVLGSEVQRDPGPSQPGSRP
jgi:hypothetical protein